MMLYTQKNWVGFRTPPWALHKYINCHYQNPPSLSHTCYTTAEVAEVVQDSGNTLGLSCTLQKQVIVFLVSLAAGLYKNETQQPTYVYTPQTHQTNANTIKVDAGGVW